MSKTLTKCRPILFSPALAGKVHDGSKTQTRRVVKRGHVFKFCPGGDLSADERSRINADPFMWDRPNDPTMDELLSICPYGKPGGRVYVREAWSLSTGLQDDHNGVVTYRDGGTKVIHWRDGHRIHDRYGYIEKGTSAAARIRPGIHMPRWACRTVLELTDVRVERLKDITESDAEKEGFARKCGCAVPPPVLKGVPRGGRDIQCPTCCQWLYSAEYQFQKLWDELNGPRGHSWGSNPWVWVLTFKKVEAHNE